MILAMKAAVLNAYTGPIKITDVDHLGQEAAHEAKIIAFSSHSQITVKNAPQSVSDAAHHDAQKHRFPAKCQAVSTHL